MVDDVTGDNGAPSRLTAASRLAARQREVELEERREALRLLITCPLIPAEGETSTDFRLVRRNAEWLKRWLTRWPGWTLVVASDVARLRKHPSPRSDATRGLEEKSGADRTLITRRGYALLCLVLATLENEHRQTTIQQVARKTELAVRVDQDLADVGFQYDTKSLSHRRELVSVMRRLERWHVLVRIDRDDADFVQSDGDCLYRIDRAALSTVLCSVRGASTVEAADVPSLIQQLNEVETPESPDAQNRELQHWLVRRLLDDPVMYFDELTARERDYFQSQGERLLRELTHATGMVAERRAEGVALLDPAGGWTDVGLPELGTRGHATLLLAEWLANELRDSEQSDCHISIDRVESRLSELASRHKKHWRKGADTEEGVRRLTRDSLEILRSLGLIDLQAGQVIPRPAIGRYRVATTEAES